MPVEASQSQIFELLSKQLALLEGKDKQLKELQDLCDDERQWNLICHLLNKFEYVLYPKYGELLKDMSSYIEGMIAGMESEYCLLATANNSEADSSQGLLQNLKYTLCDSMSKGLETCNNFGIRFRFQKTHPNVKKYILVDEFCGSGKTIKDRCDVMRKEGREVQVCLLAGIDTAVQKVRMSGCGIHCCWELPKGITGDAEWTKEDKNVYKDVMLLLESKLAPKISDTLLEENSLGYGKAEALFAIANQNPPNSIFPIFWWKKYLDDSDRLTLFRRCQRGY